MKQFVKLVLVVAILFSAAVSSNAQTCSPLSAGCFDNTFGNNGKSVTYVPTTLNLPSAEGAAQNDGKILALADAHLNTGLSFSNVIIRYNADGSIDTGFGSAGFVYMNWNGTNNSFGNAYAISTQLIGTEEKIIVAGSAASGGLRVDRYNSDGSIDTSFGTNGSAILSNGGYALAVAVQSDGKVLTMGDASVLVRLNANGTPDVTFGSNGVSQAGISVVKAQSLAVQSTGRIIAVGNSTLKGKGILTVARFNTNGSLDDGGRTDSTPGDSFGTAGKTTIDFNAAGSGGSDVKIDVAGKIVVSGTALNKNAPSDFAIARLTVNGQLDTTFAVGGKATLDFNGLGDSARKVQIQSSGKIVLFGTTNPPDTTQNFVMARYNPNGSLDETFGQGGKVATNFSVERENMYDGVIQFDTLCSCEKIVAVGAMEVGGQAYAVAARYIP